MDLVPSAPRLLLLERAHGSAVIGGDDLRKNKRLCDKREDVLAERQKLQSAVGVFVQHGER